MPKQTSQLIERKAPPMLRDFVIVLSAALSIAMIAVWLGPAPLVLGPLLAGAWIGIAVAELRRALVLSVVSSVLGAGFAFGLANAGESFARVVTATSTLGRALSAFHQRWMIVRFEDHALVGTDAVLNVLLWAVWAALLAAAMTFLVNQQRASVADPARFARIVLRVLVAVVAVSAGFAAFTDAPESFQKAAREPLLAPGSYGFDGAIYVQTYNYLAHEDVPYYRALQKAVVDDMRWGKAAMKDGKLVLWAPTPTLVRQPWTAWLWQAATFGGTIAEVRLLAAFVIALLLYGIGWALGPLIGVRAWPVVACLAPVLVTLAVVDNVFFADFWAAMAVLASLIALLRGRFGLALVAMAAACLFRETVAPVFLLLCGVAVVLELWRREDGWLRRSAFVAGVAAVTVAAMAVHYSIAAGYTGGGEQANDAADIMRGSMARPFGDRFIAPLTYALQSYGAHLWPAWLIAIVQVPAWWFVLRAMPKARVFVLTYVAFWLVFLATLGASSAYWGQVVTPVALVGVLAAFASLDRLVAAGVRGGSAALVTSKKRVGEAPA